MREAGPGRSPAASLVRMTAARLGRMDRRELTVAVAYPVVTAGVLVLAADLLSDVIASAFAVSKDVVATFAVVLGVLLFGWSAESTVRWILTHWPRHDSSADAVRKSR
jgi:hypothetical protein